MNGESGSSVRVIRPKGWLLAAAVVSALLFAAGGVFTYRDSGWSATTVGFAVMTVLGCAGVLEFVTSRIVLSDDALIFGSMWSRQRYAVDAIESVTWAAGSGVAVKLSAGGWASLPELGYNSQALANTLRAWLKRARREEI